MKSNREHRFEDNPKEKEFHDKFLKEFDSGSGIILSAIVNGWSSERQEYPKKYLSEEEEDICLNLITWLGSPVGQGFLDMCGFVPKSEK